MWSRRLPLNLIKERYQLSGMSVKLIVIFAVIVLAKNTFAFCFEEAGRMYGINPQILWSIAKVESGFRQSAININSNGSYDVGVMQINSFWKKYFTPTQWKMIETDPCTNVKVGAWVLAQCIQKYGYTWEAIGCYNAVSDHKRVKYAHKINKVLMEQRQKR